MKKLKVIEIILILFFISSLVYIIYGNFKENKEMKIYEDIRKSMRAEEHGRKKAYEKDISEEYSLYEEYLRVKDINDDVVGWININNTRIDYPVLQTKDNLFYLEHNINKEKSKIGSIYVDYEVNLETSFKNIIIYGHNMKSGDMFGDLQKYKSKEFFDNNSIINLSIVGEKLQYEIFGVCIINVDDSDEVFNFNEFIEPKSDEETHNYIDEVKKRRLYDTGVIVSTEDRFITLTTCTEEADDTRLVIFGKEILD